MILPYVNLTASVRVDEAAEDAFKSGAAAALSEVAGKPENYLFVSIQGGQTLFLRGQRASGAVLQVHLVGSLSRSQKKEVTVRLCRLCREVLGIPEEAVYIIFNEVAGENWGWNGGTFG